MHAKRPPRQRLGTDGQSGSKRKADRRSLQDGGHQEGIDSLVMEYLEGRGHACRKTRGRPLTINDSSGWPINASPTNALRRELGRWDLALLFVVAVLNLNTVSSIATSRPVALWLWLAALLCFFLPQGISAI